MTARGGTRAVALAWLAVALLALPATAAAQPPTGATTAADTLAPRARADGGRLRPVRLLYRLSLLRDTAPPQPIGERQVAVTETSYGGQRAWAIADARLGQAGPGGDSVVVAYEDLSPLAWSSSSPAGKLSAAVSRDTLYGALESRVGRRSLVVPAERGAVASAGVLETMLGVLPLAPGWEGSLPLLSLDLGGGRVAPARVSVLGEERVTVPGGRFDCWVVIVRAGEAMRTLWVSRDRGVVVRSIQSMPHIPGATLEQVLATPPR